ncbi:hypothetical protein PIB30_048861 [Stylosanthes scabra]|uniref:Uncharacterized protein n=1 Tax=Stylosanthes scabra TaxID=79078 RepID=A0ABU6YG08_9FABA|nr:hypothetical protein [Stylosanthes scabra]
MTGFGGSLIPSALRNQFLNPCSPQILHHNHWAMSLFEWFLFTPIGFGTYRVGSYSTTAPALNRLINPHTLISLIPHHVKKLRRSYTRSVALPSSADQVSA